MKILHVLYAGLGGHGNVFFSFVNADKDKKIEFEALFFGVEEVRKEYITQCNIKNIKYYFVKKKPGVDIAYLKLILYYIKYSNPDIIFLHGSAYILPAKIAGIFSKKKYRIIVRETQANHLKTKAQWLSLGWAMLLADKIVCLTEEFNTQIKQKLKFFYKQKKVIVIPNGLDLTLYKPKKIALSNDTFYIGMQSRIVSIKDHTTLLKAFLLVKKSKDNYGKKIKLKIAGDGDYKQKLIALAKELAIEDDVLFTGMLNEEALIIFLQSLDLYVHASLGETMSTAIMQAMACRLPVIASNVSGISNMIITNVTGILVMPKNELQMANALHECISNIELRNNLAENAYQFALNNFSNQAMLNAYNKNVFN